MEIFASEAVNYILKQDKLLKTTNINYVMAWMNFANNTIYFLWELWDGSILILHTFTVKLHNWSSELYVQEPVHEVKMTLVKCFFYVIITIQS